MIPYVAGMNEDIGRVCRKFDISRQGQTTRELLLKEALYIQMTTAEEYFNTDKNPGLLDCIHEETGREGQFSPTFDLG